MDIRKLESAILVEARIVTNNKKLRQKDIIEWSTGEIKPEQGETLHYLPTLKINIAVKDRKEPK